MSKPRYLPLDCAIHAMRKTRDNLPFFAPTPLVLHAVRFILAVAAQRYAVGIVSFAIMGNHLHILAFDEDIFAPHGNRVVDFLQFVHSTLALFTGHQWEVTGARFDPDSTGKLVLMADHHAELDTTVYINLNPVDAAIVVDPFRTQLVGAPELYLTGERIERPDTWFSPRSWPDSAILCLKVPPKAEAAGYTALTWAEEVEARTRREAASIHLEKRRKGKRFTGVLAAARKTPDKGPISEHKAGHSEAILKGSGLAAARLFAAYRAFQRAYPMAMARLRGGDGEAKFPMGTYKMVKQCSRRGRMPRVKVDIGRWFAARMVGHELPPA